MRVDVQTKIYLNAKFVDFIRVTTCKFHINKNDKADKILIETLLTRNMNIFEINGRKITFHVVGISKESQEALKFTIKDTGAEIINSEECTVLFTSAEVLREIQLPRALIYNINFIIQCVIERRIVDPKPHRLDKRGQEYEYLMRHFLYGTCKKNFATISQTSCEYATAITSPANAASTSVPNLAFKQEKIDELVDESMPKGPVISTIKHEETVVSNERMDCDPSIGEIVCKIESKSDDEVQIIAPEDVSQPASGTKKSTVVPVERSTKINRWLGSQSCSSQFAVCRVAVCRVAVAESQVVSSVNLDTLSNIDQSNKPINPEVASPSGSTVNSNTLSNIEQSNEPIKQGSVSPSGCADNLNTLSNIDRSTKRRKQDTSSPFDFTDNLNALSDINQSDKPIEKQKDDSQSSSPSSSSSEIMARSKNIQKKKARRLFSNKTTIEASSNRNQSHNPIDKQTDGSQSSSSSSSSSEIMTRSKNIQKKKARRLFSNKTTIEASSNRNQSHNPIDKQTDGSQSSSSSSSSSEIMTRSKNIQKKKTRRLFSNKTTIEALSNINQSDNPIEKQKDGSQSSSSSSSSSEIMTRSKNVQKKKTRRLFSNKTTIETLSNINQSNNPIEKQKDGSQSSSPSSSSSEIMTRSKNIQKKKTRRLFSLKPTIEDSEEEEPSTISTRDRAGTSGLQKKPAKRKDNDDYEVEESSESSESSDIDHKVPVKKGNKGDINKVRLWRDTINKKVPPEERGKPFKAWERREMINYLVTRRCIHQGKGQLVWSRMIEAGLLTHRSAQSLYNQFRRKILDNIEQAKLSKEVLKQFLELRKKRRRRKKW